MIRVWLLSIALLLAACGAQPPMRAEGKGPALWRIEKGSQSGYIFGTIHVLPRDLAWQTRTMQAAMAASDRLVLEAAGLDDQDATQRIFDGMGRSKNLPPITARVSRADQPSLRALINRGHMNEQSLSGYESWAAALVLATVAQGDLGLSGAQGVEPALTAIFRMANKPVEGLEAIEAQFNLFDRLPEPAQRRLLAETVDQAAGARRQYDAMLKAWLSGDMQVIANDFISELAPEPELVGPLLTDRNRAWADRIARLQGSPFIAVGAAHLAGPDNVIALLQASGFRVTRVQ